MGRRDSLLRRCVGAFNPMRAARAMAALWEDGRWASSRNGISLPRIACEQFALYLVSNINRQEFYLNSLYDPALSWREKTAFISSRNTRKVLSVLTPGRYECLFANKLAFGRFFGSAGLATARLYGVFDPQWGSTAEGASLRTAGDLRALADGLELDSFVLKPVESQGGWMVRPLRREGEGWTTPDGAAVSCEDLVAWMRDPARLREAYPDEPHPPRTFLVEERLRPHQTLGELACETLCSVRAVTLVDLQGSIHLLGAALRMPLSDIGTDNMTQGSLAIPVDLDTGVLGEGVRAYELPPVRHAAHPVTGKRFAGLRLPDWQQAADLVRAAARAFPLARAIGWDVGFSTRGPVLIEGNHDFSTSVTQRAYHRGLCQGELRRTYLALAGRRTGQRVPEGA